MNLLECKILQSPRYLGSSMFKYMNTISFCKISHEKNKKTYNTTFKVKFNENYLEEDKSNYFEYLIKKFLSFIINKNYFPFRLFNIEFNISYMNRNRNLVLMCVFNSLSLALVEAGIPLNNLFYSVYADYNIEDTLIVYMNDKVIFIHGTYNSIDESNVNIIKEDIKEYIEFEIEKVL